VFDLHHVVETFDQSARRWRIKFENTPTRDVNFIHKMYGELLVGLQRSRFKDVEALERLLGDTLPKFKVKFVI